MNKNKIIIATVKEWNLLRANNFKKSSKYDIIIISSKDDLTISEVSKINPKYIFFPHWSWFIPEEIWSKYECVVFHMTDLPFGRGGSPLQNLLIRGIYETKISALKVVEETDAGPIYLKRKINIEYGTAEEIYDNISSIIFGEMIPFILKENPLPRHQEGEIVSFKRRQSNESNILLNDFKNINQIYDFVRMLDAESYPRAFLKIGKYKMLFKNVIKDQGKIMGTWEIYDEEK